MDASQNTALSKNSNMTTNAQAPQKPNSPALCEPCSGIQRHWRKAPGHAELVQGTHQREDRGNGQASFTRYRCDRCGAAWEYENNKVNQHAGWALLQH
jgi:hypothetical protein